MSPRPLILITNDDGYGAAGIEALALAMSEVGEVAVVAPDRDRSGIAHAISLSVPLRARSRGALRWSVDGTPTDCVYLGVHHLIGRRPDLVVSGINHGPNLADDALYSGTVGAAMEGAQVGLPAVAVSLASMRPRRFDVAASFAARVARMVLDRGLPQRTLLNVNVPETDGGPIKGYRWARAGIRDYGHEVTENLDPRRRPYYWIGGNFLGHLGVPGSDCDAVDEGYAAITPLKLDLTDEALLTTLSAVDLGGPDASGTD